MTRKEQILQAARNYVSGVMLSSPSDVIHFGYGAKWADEHPNLESLWHDASEEPLLEETKFIFITEHDSAYISERNGGYFSHTLVDCSWEEYVNSLKIKKWTYVKDLLLKGGEKRWMC